MNLLRYAVFIALLCHSLYASGQKSSGDKRAQAAYDKAARHLSLQRTDLAIAELHKAVELDPTFATAYQQLADLFRKQGEYPVAIPHYQKVLELDPGLTSLTYYGLGECLLNTGRYKEALPYLEQYAKNNLNDKSRRTVEKYIQDCRFSLQQFQSSAVHLEKLPHAINTINDEYFPKLTADNNTIIFTRKTDNQENFYESKRDKEKWSEAQKLIGYVNSELFNEGAHCISPDGKYLFFTGCNRPNGLGSCDIYVSKKENDSWGAPVNLGAPINTKGWESQPAISADGHTLYFVSNRPGGQGGYDIWKSELDSDGKWQAPVNLGQQINTFFDESAPYIHPDNKTLYFASNGWPGFGQQDLYKSELDSMGSWSNPVNLGSPINNNYNQTALHVSMNGVMGFISTQDSSNQLDIYTFELPANIQPHPVAYIEGVVLDAESKTPLSAFVSVTNTKTQEVVYQDNADYHDGKFLATLPLGANYAVHIQHKGYLFDSKQYDLYDSALREEKFSGQILLRPIKTGNYTQLSNVYFDIDKSDLLPGSLPELQILLTFLSLNATTVIEIAGHTDNTGSKPHNQKLSEERAKSVAGFLIKNGIRADRLVSIGYGDQKPIVSNDTPESRRLNRRTEIKILK